MEITKAELFFFFLFTEKYNGDIDLPQFSKY